MLTAFRDDGATLFTFTLIALDIPQINVGSHDLQLFATYPVG